MTVTTELELLAQTKQFSIDTRTLKKGDVYIAIRGEHLDGHQFVAEALRLGATHVIVDHAVAVAIPQTIVPNTVTALQHIAAYHRLQMMLQVVAVTGSCGKTTTRAFLEHIFSEVGATHASVGSFNNHIGVPLTLLKLQPHHQFLIAEIGANHVGEIATLVPLVKPDVAIITNVGPAHLEGFGSLENIARAKSEIYSGLSTEGIAIINQDDPFSDFFKECNKHRSMITFGIDHVADVMACDITLDARGCATFTLVLPDRSRSTVSLAIPGKHTVYNALAAAAGSVALHVSLPQIQAGLEKTDAVERRLIEKRSAVGTVIIDDSYNANPLSTAAAIHLLATRSGERVFVLGDMRELGADALRLHAEIGSLAKKVGIEYLFCYGDLTQHAARAFGVNGYYFSDKSALIESLKAILKPGQTMLVKGSFSMRMNEVVEALLTH